MKHRVRNIRLVWSALVAVVGVATLVTACGEDGGASDSPAAGGNTGAGASSTGTPSGASGGQPATGAGGAGGAVNPSGGNSATGGSTTTLLTGGAHCSPGKFYSEVAAYASEGGPIAICNKYDARGEGVAAIDFPTVSSIALDTPLAAGDTWTISMEFAMDGVIEYWGATSECGVGVEKLGEVPGGTYTACISLTGKQQYTHILMLWPHFGGQHYGVTICPDGTCQ